MGDTYRMEYIKSQQDRAHGERVYDPVTKKWVQKSPNKEPSVPQTKPSSSAPSTSNSKPNPSKVDSKKKADKKYIDIEFNTLVGEAIVVPNKGNIKINVNDTVDVVGIGKFLSGKYFVSSIKRSISKDSGYSETLTLIKTGFGDKVKQSSKVEGVGNEARKQLVTKKPSSGNPKVGDKVKIVGSSATYSNASDGVKVPNWVKSKVLTIDSVSKDGTRVKLKEINSWTYIKFIKKV